MKKLILLSLIAVLGFGLNSCSKYEEGPSLSLRTKKARLVNEWVIQSYTVGGQDYTSTLPEDYTLNIKDDETFELTSNGQKELGTWEFFEDKEKLKLTSNGTVGTSMIFTILMLKNDDLKLKSDIVGSETIYTYISK
ncbi:MAG: hypothetical protein JXR34_00825 [Bacteroidales bacterium]|nr:hypothetical protein [Bacteroidales bacterium]